MHERGFIKINNDLKHKLKTIMFTGADNLNE